MTLKNQCPTRVSHVRSTRLMTLRFLACSLLDCMEELLMHNSMQNVPSAMNRADWVCEQWEAGCDDLTPSHDSCKQKQHQTFDILGPRYLCLPKEALKWILDVHGVHCCPTSSNCHLLEQTVGSAETQQHSADMSSQASGNTFAFYSE